MRSKVPYIIVIALVTFAVYSGALSNGFVYDDNFQVEANPWITSFGNIGTIFSSATWDFDPNHPPSNYYRPVMYIVYMAAHLFFGLKAWGFHLVNIFLHAINSILVFALASHFLRERATGTRAKNCAALLAGLVFATHPINTEAVIWVASVPELTFTMFYLAAFYLYVVSKGDGAHGTKSKGLWPSVVISAALFFLSAISKEPAMTLPVLVVLYDLIKRRGGAEGAREWIRNIRAYVIFAAAGGAYLVLRFTALGGAAPKEALGGGPGLGPYEYVLNLVVLFARYINSLIAPANLSLIHILDPIGRAAHPAVPASVVLLIVGAVLLWRLGRVSRDYFVFATLVVLPLLPPLYLLGINRTPFAERYLYLPSAGFALIVALSALSLTGYAQSNGTNGGSAKKAAWAALVVLALLPIVYSARTIARIPEWRDNTTVWETILERDPDNYLALNSLGAIYMSTKSMDTGMAFIKKAIEVNSMRRRPDLEALEHSHLTLAAAYLRKGQLDSAIAGFEKAAELDPDHPMVNYNLAYALHKKGRLDDAEIYYRKALAEFKDPADRQATLANLGNIHLARGEWTRAADHYEEALRIYPDDMEVRFSLETAKKRIGQR